METCPGCILAPVNWRWSAVEARAALELCGAEALAVDAACLPLLAAALAAPPPPPLRGGNAGGSARLRAILCLGDLPPAAAAAALASSPGLAVASAAGLACAPAAAGAPALALALAACGTAVLCFTSGTTGAPKAVALSHAAFHGQSLAKLAAAGYGPADVYLHAAPLFHVGGLSSAFAMLMAGAAHVLMPRRVRSRCAGGPPPPPPTLPPPLPPAQCAALLPPTSLLPLSPFFC
jgi:acyl-activating enzyme 14